MFFDIIECVKFNSSKSIISIRNIILITNCSYRLTFL